CVFAFGGTDFASAAEAQRRMDTRITRDFRDMSRLLLWNNSQRPIFWEYPLLFTLVDVVAGAYGLLRRLATRRFATMVGRWLLAVGRWQLAVGRKGMPTLPPTAPLMSIGCHDFPRRPR